MTKLVRVAKTAFQGFIDEPIMTHAAALAFYTSLSLPPILVLLLSLLGTIDAAGEDLIMEQASTLIGAEGENLVQSILDRSEGGVRVKNVAGVISLIALIFAASAVFAQLQLSLNRIWEVEAKPGIGLWGWLRKRLLSIGMIGAIAFLLLVSLVASTLIGMLGLDSSGSGVVSRIVSLVTSLGLFTLLFALVFKLLPDVKIGWKRVWGGAFVTSLLFTFGKFAIGVYLSQRGLGSTYGAAGSVIVVLSWVYFSSFLVFFGAELTQAWVKVKGDRLEPNAHAVKLERKVPATGSVSGKR